VPLTSATQFSRAGFFLGLAAVLGGCQTPASSVGVGAPVPYTASSPGINSSNNSPTSRVQLLNLQTGQPTSFTTQSGKALTVIASAATYSTSAPSFQLSVTLPGVQTATSGHYQTASLGALAWPFRFGFVDSNRPLLSAIPTSARVSRHLLDTSTPLALGSQDKFWINKGNSQADSDSQQTCTLKRISAHGFFYVDTQAQPISDAQLDSLVSEFENKDYPRESSVFSPPGTLGFGSHIYIVISPAVDNFGQEKGLMGYFWSRDVLPNPDASLHSNQKEAVFLTDQLFSYPTLTSFGTLAHEFQHLINFTNKAANTNYGVSEETWLDEGLAMYAMEVAGYGLPAGDKLIAKDLNGFEQNPSAYSLTDWDNNPNGFSYGQSYLFVRYLVDRYGQGIIKEIIQSPTAGQQSLETILAKHGDNFTNFFQNWTIANLISGTPTAQGTPYNYKNLNLAGNYGGFQLQGFQPIAASQTTIAANLRPWGSAYYNFSAVTPQAWKFNLSNPNNTPLLGTAIVPAS
jgi:hypothetical protein